MAKLPGMKLFLVALLLWWVGATGEAASLDQHAAKLASLIDPAKLATLAKRGANPRIQKAVAILAQAESEKLDAGEVCALAVQRVKVNPAAGELTKAALLRNLDIARKLDCLDAAGLDEMRHGKAATIRRGPYKGEELSVDHIIPRAVVPELDNVIANLELMPLGMNQSKNAWVGERQFALAEKLHAAGLLSPEGLEKVRRASTTPRRTAAAYCHPRVGLFDHPLALCFADQNR